MDNKPMRVSFLLKTKGVSVFHESARVVFKTVRFLVIFRGTFLKTEGFCQKSFAYI